jgi:C4-dicarboxylate-specific signal transduction histidine kinase
MEAVEPEIAAEVKHLKACINDLMVVLALPAIWSGSEPAQIARTLVDVVLGMLRLDFVYVLLENEAGGAPIEIMEFARSQNLQVRPQEILEMLARWLGDELKQWPPAGSPFVGLDITTVPLRLGMHGEIGAMVVASARTNFPEEIERLLLGVAANQAAVGVQEARLRNQQKRIADELDRRVAQRTAELAIANQELKKEIAERRLAVERLRREQSELKRSEALLAETQQLSSTGSFTWHVLTDEITWSDQSYRIFQVDRATPVTLGLITTRVHPADLPAFNEHLERTRSERRDEQFDFRLLLPDGQVKYLHVLAHRVEDVAGDEEIVGAIMDISEARKSQAALEAAQTALAHAGRVATLVETSATIAHEINQPLAAIVANAEASLRWQSRADPDLAKVAQLTRQIVNDACRANDIVQRIRAMAAKQEPERIPVDLNEVVAEALLFVRHEVESRSIKLSVKFRASHSIVLGDRIQLQQVIVNLLVNSIHAVTQADGSMRKIQLDSGGAKDDTIFFSIRDSGPGIPDENIEHVFESFFTTKGSGMGIGLAICHSIIRAHGGNIAVANHPEGGAQFRFVLPAIASSPLQ